jgi:hypothetical protein
MDINDFLVFTEPLRLELKDFEQIGKTPFRLNALNGIYAPSKTGKTYFALEQLEPIAKEGQYNVIWLDGDRNMELKNKIQYIQHLPVKSPRHALEKIINQKGCFDNYIFIIDSFKNFTFGYDVDNNGSCQLIFDKYQELLNLGATLIVIFHATKIRSDGYSHDFKTKGNEDTIESNMDFYYKFERTTNAVTLTIQCARDANMRIGTSIQYADIAYITEKIKDIVVKNPEITLRDLKRMDGMSGLEPTIETLCGSLYVTETLRNGGRGAPKEVVRLIAA